MIGYRKHSSQFSFIIVLMLLSAYSFGQDTTSKIVLKPLRDLPIMTTEQIAMQIDMDLDSIYNTDSCKYFREAYYAIYQKNQDKLTAAKKEVKVLNSTNTGFYYFLVLIHKPIDRGKSACWERIPIMISSGDVGCDYDVSIDKKEKSRLILDGPTGEVFYYEDIKLMPY